jgi:hypothetical protein
MLKAVVASILFTFCAQTASAQSKPTTFATGRTWNVLTDEIKTWYLIGFKDGLGFSQTIEKYWGTFSVNDYKKELDKVYNEGENVEIPIWLAFRYVSLKLEGTHKTDYLENFLMTLRQAPKPDPPPKQ